MQALEQTRQACIERDRRMAYLEAELDLSQAQSASQLRALAALGAELDELRVTARGQATRIRLGALREAAEVSARIRVLAGAPEDAAESMLAALERALERLGTDEAAADPPDGGRPGGPLAVPVPDQPRREDVGSELAELEAAMESEPVPAPGHGSQVTVDVGPFSDFSQLVSFEDAANAIGATGEISIRRFSEGRASIDVYLREPIDLLAELEANCELRFRVRARDDSGLVLDLSE